MMPILGEDRLCVAEVPDNDLCAGHLCELGYGHEDAHRAEIRIAGTSYVLIATWTTAADAVWTTHRQPAADVAAEGSEQPCPAAHGALGRICELPAGHPGPHTGPSPNGGAVWEGDASGSEQ